MTGPLIAASLHVCEEFVYPGGFRQWYASYRPEIASSLSVGYLVLVNAIMLAACALIAVAGPFAQWLGKLVRDRVDFVLEYGRSHSGRVAHEDVLARHCH